MVSYAYLVELRPRRNRVVGVARNMLSVLMVASPFLVYYKSPVLVNNLSSLILIVEFSLAAFVIVSQKKIRILKLSVDHTILLFWLLCITLFISLFDFFGSLSQDFSTTSSLIVLVSILLFFAFSGAINIYLFLRLYQFACFVVLSFHAMQMIMFYLAKIPLLGNIPFLELNPAYSIAFGRLDALVGSPSSNLRFSSVFSEPAHLAQYVIPFLCMKLYGVKNVVKANIGHAFIISVLILLSISGFGIVSVFIIWIMYLLTGRGRRGIVKRLLILVIGLSVIMITFSIFLQMPVFSDTVERLFVSAGTGSSKADYRVYRGFEIYFAMPLSNQMFGTGYRNASSAAGYFGFSTRYDVSGVNYEYMNAVAQILVYSGIIGFFLFIRMLIRIYRGSKAFGKAMVVAFFSLCISSSTFLDPTWQLYILIIYSSMATLSSYQQNTADG